MILSLNPHHYFEYLLKRDVTKFYIAMSIRNLALGMVVLFEPIYLYLYFDKSLPSVLIFFALIYGAYGLLAPLGGRIMAKIGTTTSILVSLLLYFTYFLCLFLFPVSFWFVPLSIIVIVLGLLLFWPAFHTDFARFSSKQSRGGDVGKLNVMRLLPMIVSPILGGWVLVLFGYPTLFAMVLMVLLASIVPLLYSKETHEVYSDSYKGAWKRAWKKENIATSIAFATNGLEIIVAAVFWPLFLFSLAISFESMGAMASFALIISSLFMLYIGKIADTKERPWLLNIGALWTGISWIIKYFIATTFDAFLAHALYRLSRSAAAVPFQTFFYEKASVKDAEADEFIVNREIIVNVARFVFLMLAALVFWLFPSLPINGIFFGAAILSLGFMFAGKIPKFSLK
ncbi:MAG: MFS transporter [bacterium]|nr:MFS transporter [bacterium]